jgi:outer membrane murein-binding lipoprotein Lpp
MNTRHEVTVRFPALEAFVALLESPFMPAAIDLLNQIQQQQQALLGHVQGLHDAAETTVEDLTDIKNQVGTLNQQIADLQGQLAQGGQITPDVQAKADEIAQGGQDLDALVTSTTADLQAAHGGGTAPGTPAPTPEAQPATGIQPTDQGTPPAPQP